jgi:D-3-phosphoglycerate dehydrogenase
VFLVTATTWRRQALALLGDYESSTPARHRPRRHRRAVPQHDPVAIIVRYSKVGAAAIDAAPSLKSISKHWQRTNTIDKVAAKARGSRSSRLRCERRRGRRAGAGALLPAPSPSCRFNERMHAGHWDKATHKSVELEGRTVGVIGLGRDRLALRALADADGHARARLRPVREGPAAYIESTDLATIWRESDAISLHCPLTADNAKLINAQTLAACKKGVLIVNTARGGLIDEAALLEPIRSGQVAECRPRQLRGRADDRAASVPRRSAHHAQPAHRRRDGRCLREDGRGRGEERAWRPERLTAPSGDRP